MYFAEQFKTSALVGAMSSVFEAITGGQTKCSARDLLRQYTDLLDWKSIEALENSLALYKREFVDKFKDKKFVLHPSGAEIEKTRQDNPKDGIKRLR